MIRYYFQYKNRQAVASGPKPLPIHFAPYSEWKNDPKIKEAVIQVMNFFKLQDYADER